MKRVLLLVALLLGGCDSYYDNPQGKILDLQFQVADLRQSNAKLQSDVEFYKKQVQSCYDIQTALSKYDREHATKDPNHKTTVIYVTSDTAYSTTPITDYGSTVNETAAAIRDQTSAIESATMRAAADASSAREQQERQNFLNNNLRHR